MLRSVRRTVLSSERPTVYSSRTRFTTVLFPWSSSIASFHISVSISILPRKRVHANAGRGPSKFRTSFRCVPALVLGGPDPLEQGIFHGRACGPDPQVGSGGVDPVGQKDRHE